jgi:hypothetical protein
VSLEIILATENKFLIQVLSHFYLTLCFVENLCPIMLAFFCCKSRWINYLDNVREEAMNRIFKKITMFFNLQYMFPCDSHLRPLQRVFNKPFELITVKSAVKLFFCFKRHTNEANGSIQRKIDPFASFACQTADYCDLNWAFPSLRCIASLSLS